MELIVWNVRTLEKEITPTHSGSAYSIAVVPEDSLIAAGSGETSYDLVCWEMNTWDKRRTFTDAHGGNIEAFCFSRCSRV